ncbi:MAG: hypothetical protein KY457_11680 [Actinobacteria bacterium]|nr:hypothetical protein [Actinomycetota bacterium]
MFSIHCPVEGAEVLRGPRSILSMHNTSAGVVTYVRCACGQIVVMVTGQLATEPRVHHPAPAGTPVADVAGEPVPLGA